MGREWKAPLVSSTFRSAAPPRLDQFSHRGLSGYVPSRGWHDSSHLSGNDWVIAPRAKSQLDSMISKRNARNGLLRSATAEPVIGVDNDAPASWLHSEREDSEEEEECEEEDELKKSTAGRRGFKGRMEDVEREGSFIRRREHNMPVSGYVAPTKPKGPTVLAMKTAGQANMERLRLEAQGIGIHEPGSAKRWEEHGWKSPEGRGVARGVDGLEDGMIRTCNGGLRQELYGNATVPKLVNEDGSAGTRCWYNSGFDSRINTLLSPPHHMGHAPNFARERAQVEAKERHDFMTAKHAKDVEAAPACNKHAGIPWAASFDHSSFHPPPKVSPWKLRRAAGTGCGISGGINSGASWSKEPRCPFHPHTVPESKMMDHMTRFTHGNISRTQGAALGLSGSQEMSYVLHGDMPKHMLTKVSNVVLKPVTVSTQPAERSFGSFDTQRNESQIQLV